MVTSALFWAPCLDFLTHKNIYLDVLPVDGGKGEKFFLRLKELKISSVFSQTPGFGRKFRWTFLWCPPFSSPKLIRSYIYQRIFQALRFLASCLNFCLSMLIVWVLWTYLLHLYVKTLLLIIKRRREIIKSHHWIAQTQMPLESILVSIALISETALKVVYLWAAVIRLNLEIFSLHL